MYTRLFTGIKNLGILGRMTFSVNPSERWGIDDCSICLHKKTSQYMQVELQVAE
jgi:hypothetical protein